MKNFAWYIVAGIETVKIRNSNCLGYSRYITDTFTCITNFLVIREISYLPCKKNKLFFSKIGFDHILMFLADDHLKFLKAFLHLSYMKLGAESVSNAGPSVQTREVLVGGILSMFCLPKDEAAQRVSKIGFHGY